MTLGDSNTNARFDELGLGSNVAINIWADTSQSISSQDSFQPVPINTIRKDRG